MTGSIRRISLAAALLLIALLMGRQNGLAASNAALDKFASAWSSLKGYNATIQLYEVKGNDTERATFAYAFTKPKNVTMNVKQGPNAGATVTWTGGPTVNAAKSGAFGIRLSKNVSLNDSLVTSLRGYSVADLCFGGILMHAQGTAGTLSSFSTKLDGTTVDAVALNVANPAQDNGMTREVLYLNPNTHLPVRIDGFIGSQLVRTYRFTVTSSS